MNLASIMEAHPSTSTALIAGEQRITYGELRASVACLQAGLEGLGVRPCDRVAIACCNSPAFVTAYLAVLRAGAVAAPLNPSSPGAEFGRELSEIDVRVTIADEDAADILAQLGTAATGQGKLVVARGSPPPGAVSFDSLLGGDPAGLVEREPSDLAALLFTAGTAGGPRPVCLTHGNLLSNLHQMQSAPGLAELPDDVSYLVLPLFHIFGLNVVLGRALSAGGAVVLADRFDVAEATRSIVDHHVTLLMGPPQMFAALAQVPRASGEELASIRRAVSGAAPLQEEVRQAFSSRYGVTLWQGYGLTEASPAVTAPDPDAKVRPGSIGVPIPGVEVRLVDSEGLDALIGDQGEIWVRGPNVFPGYWKDDGATKAVLTADGWLRTGDVAVADDDGYLFIVDRSKDLIIVSGFNVYPAEVEMVLRDHPSVAEAAVVASERQFLGETVHAYVVAVPGANPSSDELIEHCANNLARYKCPTEVTFVDELPRGLAGKLLRRQLP